MLSRREFVSSAAVLSAGCALGPFRLANALGQSTATRLLPFGYGNVSLHSPRHEQQLDHHLDLLMSLDEDSLLKPFRQMVGQPAPGAELGGWYSYDPQHTGIDGAYAPSATFGQWISALARMHAIRGRPEIRDKVLRLNRLYAQTIDGSYFDNNRFPAYCHDKLLCGLIDAHAWAADPEALHILDRATDAAIPHLPVRAIENGTPWRPGKDSSWVSDESYTNSENLLLAFERGAGARYRQMGIDYLDEAYYGPLSEGRSNFEGRHAYSYVNSLCSAMQAWFTLGSERHLRAARNGFEFLQAQSYATSGWGPDETLRGPGSTALHDSLANSHNSFETPCGAYAHFKLTRYLLCATGDSRYGDSMERVMYNTILGARPVQADGRTFYYADFSNAGHKVYSDRLWPCCSGTLPQVAADYRINGFFRADRSVYVNLYVPATLRWQEQGTPVSLTVSGDYPFSTSVAMGLEMSRPVEFTLHLRIPAWARGAAVAVNGRRIAAAVEPGQFLALPRTWRAGDRVELELPMGNRLEAIDAQHPDTVALLTGPLVLFPLVKKHPTITRAQLLAARKVSRQAWEADSAQGAIRLLPFVDIADERYSTYLVVT